MYQMDDNICQNVCCQNGDTVDDYIYDKCGGSVCCYEFITHQLTGPPEVTLTQSSEALPVLTS